MASVRTLSEAVADLYTTTWQKMRKTAIDNIYDSTPFFFWLRDKGKLRKLSGHKHAEVPVRYAKNTDVGWIGELEEVALNKFESLTTAKYDWKHLYASLVRSGVQEQQNKGMAQIIRIATEKLDNSKLAMVDNLETQLFASNDTEGKKLDGLQFLVADDPTASASPGGIAQDTYSWWQNKTKNMTGRSWAVYGHKDMRTVMNNCSQNQAGDKPDIIVAGQTPFEYYEDSLLTHKRMVDQKLADKYFDNVIFRGIPMIWSQACANTRVYMLNCEHIFLTYDPDRYFRMTEWKYIPNQIFDYAAQIVATVSLTVAKRRCQGVLHTIDTA